MNTILQDFQKNIDSYSQLLGKSVTYNAKNLNLAHNQGKISPLDAVKKKVIAVEIQEEV